MKVVLNKIIFFIGFCSMVMSLHAQYTVRGIVKDSLTNEPLSYISVYLKGGTEGCLTNDNGGFTFNTTRDKAELIVSAVGYNSYVRTIYPSRGGRFTISLSPTAYSLNEIVIKPKRERYKKR